MKWLPDCFNDIGVIVTIIGFAVTIWQILSLKSRQKVIEEATNSAIGKLKSFDHALTISKSKEIINRLKSSTDVSQFPYIDQQIQELKNELIYCKSICPENEGTISNTLQALTSIMGSINKVLINPNNRLNFDFELFFLTLDQIRDIFSLAIAKSMI
jgi:hypothetical protein